MDAINLPRGKKVDEKGLARQPLLKALYNRVPELAHLWRHIR